MLLEELSQGAYPLIKQQHDLVRSFSTGRERYEHEIQEAQARFSQEKATNEQRWKAVLNDLAQTLRPIIAAETSTFRSYSAFRSSSWSTWKDVVRAEFTDLETPENQAYYVQQIRTVLQFAGLGNSPPQAFGSALAQSGIFYELIAHILPEAGDYRQSDQGYGERAEETRAKQVAKQRLEKFNNLPETSLLPRKTTEIDRAIERCRQESTALSAEIRSFHSFYEGPGILNATLLGALGWSSAGAFVVLMIILGIAFNGVSMATVFFSLFVPLSIFGGVYSLVRMNAIRKARRLAGELKATITLAEKLGQRKLAGLEQNYLRQKEEIEKRFTEAQKQIDQKYSLFLEALRQNFAVYIQTVSASFAGCGWEENTQWSSWTPATASPAVARLGMLQVQHPQMPALPALLACPAGQNVLFKVTGDGSAVAAQAIEALVLRLLAIHQPGKVQFTLIDPVGSGKNVAGFIPLSDLDEELIGPRAWTDERHIDTQLIDVQDKMEVVIQQLQGRKFKTLDEYNAQAAVTEPYHIVVVIGFPAEFTDRSANRLLRIATNGRAAGFSVVMIMDLKAKRPYDFKIEDFERVATVFEWNGSEFVWTDDDFATSTLRLDTPPPAQLFDQILQQVGSLSKSARQVAINFDRYLPQVIWDRQQKTDQALSCDLGPSSATRTQSLSLNSDDEVNVLVAGRIGSGKTNLMHVVIMGLALKYHPDELELYLVDLKSVGFVQYGLYKLPHARVVASESEREFALSVLQRLDNELSRRRTTFKMAAKTFSTRVEKLAEFRQVQPDARMPRILLIVDEFQELFRPDEDFIHRKSLEILERLARLGRAFGIHLLLGSQTLRGAYTISKATMSQMVIRIALQCNAEDSEYILEQGNTAARNLSRSGAAIYNDNQGAFGNNREFQCAWIAREEFTSHLDMLRRHAQHEGYIPPEEQVVFQGKAYASVASNRLLAQALGWAYRPVRMLPAVPCWVGEPIEIKEPASVVFQSQTANNLLLVAQLDQAREIMGMFIAMLYSLAAQHAPDTARFYIADYSPGDADYVGSLAQVAQLLTSHQITLLNRHTLANVLQHLSGEVQQRLEQDEVSGWHIYLFIFGLQRVRDLHPSRDDFGYGMSFKDDDASAAPDLASSFATILRHGPEVGMHTVVWCDTMTNLSRALERNALREFDLRVAFQMSAEDSNNLIGSSDASRLGSYRAYLYDEGKNTLEKFCPYELPDEAWRREAAAEIVRKV